MHQLIKGFYNTPPLWKKEQFGIGQFVFPEMNTETTLETQIPNNLRLGHQMEHVCKTILKATDRYETLRSNVLIDTGKKRVGELDFLLKDRKANRFLHMELAYKFYIIDPTKSEPIYRLMGPNKRDMFYTKLDKLKEKQFPLLYHDSLHPIWNSLGIDPLEIEQQCCFKAQLFTPYGENSVHIRPLNADCSVGSWIRFDDFNSNTFSKAQFYIPTKMEWIIKPHDQVQWLNHFEALIEINLRMIKENSPMLWVKRPKGEIEKLFVVWW